MSVRKTIVEVDLSTMNVAAFCRDHGISRDRFYAIRRRYQSEGEAGLEPRSRAPHRVRNRSTAETEDLVIAVRKELLDLGVDAGAATIAFHLESRMTDGAALPSESTIWRILTRRGFITAEPSKAPKRAARSFAAERANECWQIDDTKWDLADSTTVRVINVIDDCTRVCTAARVVATCTGTEALDAMADAAARWGWPERVLSDNAKAFRFTLAEALAELGVAAGHSRPYHPQTCGKVERFHQTLKLFLTAQTPAETLHELQSQIDRFCDYYNQQRPHRSLGRAIPAKVWTATPKSGPANHPITGPPQIAHSKVHNGLVQHGRRHVISVGAAYNDQQATSIISGTKAHVFADGRLVRELTIDPTQRRYPLYNRSGPPKRSPR